MKVRLNKGPYHRKLYDVDVDAIQKGLQFSKINKLSFSNQMRVAGKNDKATFYVNPDVDLLFYRVKMVQVDMGRGMEWIPSVFPDGAVCFEYGGKI